MLNIPTGRKIELKRGAIFRTTTTKYARAVVHSWVGRVIRIQLHLLVFNSDTVAMYQRCSQIIGLISKGTGN